jgi:hypothetical protein
MTKTLADKLATPAFHFIAMHNRIQKAKAEAKLQ